MTIVTKGMGAIIKKFGKKTATHMQKQATRHKAWKKMGMKGPKYKIGKKVKGSHHLDEVWTYNKNYKEKAKGGRIGFKKGKRIGMRTEAGKITDKRQRLYEQAHGEHFTTGLFGRKKSDASTGGGAPPPLRLLSSMKDYWQGKPDSLKRLRKFNKENPPPKGSKYQLKKGGKV